MITKMSCLQSLWTGVNPVWAGKSSRLQVSFWTEVSPLWTGKSSRLQTSLWTEVSPVCAGNRSYPCVDWEFQERRDARPCR